MIKKIGILMVVYLLMGCQSVTTTHPEIFQVLGTREAGDYSVKNAVIRGSGVMNYTAAHVLSDQKLFYFIKTSEDKVYPLLSSTGTSRISSFQSSYTGKNISIGEVLIDENVWIWGYSWGVLIQKSWQVVSCQNLECIVNTSCLPGMSGGGVWNQEWELLGIIQSTSVSECRFSRLK